MNRLKLIAQYLEIRFPNSPQYYHQQWIDRFNRGKEWNYSDFFGRRVLHKLAPNWYWKNPTVRRVKTGNY